jgi:serine/threonine protein phosphatase PrpC
MKACWRRLLALLILFCCIRVKSWILDSRVISFPAPHKLSSGEDAWFCHSRDIGVFDGVGAWADEGIDSGVFSRAIAKYMFNLIQIERSYGTEEINLVTALDFATEQCRLDNITGSCTACAASIDSSAQLLHILNLGDSSLLILREEREKCRYKTVFKTSPLSHSFNAPYQVGNKAMVQNSGDTLIVMYDTSRDASLSAVPIQLGDVIVLGSDGFFDNIYDAQIEDIVTQKLLSRLNDSSFDALQETVEALYNRARAAAEGSHPTPWSDALRQQTCKSSPLHPLEVLIISISKLFNRQGKERTADCGLLPVVKAKAQQKQEKATTTGGGKPDDVTIIIAKLT